MSRGQVVVEDYDVRVDVLNDLLYLVGFTATDEVGLVGLISFLEGAFYDDRTGSVCEECQLVQRVLDFRPKRAIRCKTYENGTLGCCGWRCGVGVGRVNSCLPLPSR